MSEMQLLKYNFAKVKSNPKFAQELREIAQHGRSVTIAVDVRMYAIMSGEVRITRNGRISIQGWVASQFFEDTFTEIYMRGLEVKQDHGNGRAQSSRELSQVFERAQAEIEVVDGTHNNRCYLCNKENLDRTCWCAYCNRPIAQYGQTVYGRPAQGRRLADYFEQIHHKLLAGNVKFADATVRMEGMMVDWRCIVAMLAAMNPAEDLFIQMRTGYQVDEYAVRRVPSIYRAKVAEMVAISSTLSHMMMLMASKQYNHNDRTFKTPMMEARNPADFYALDINRSMTKAASMFHTYPTGCSLRAVVWFCAEMGFAYDGAIRLGIGGCGGINADLMRSNFSNHMASIVDEFKIDLFNSEERKVMTSTVTSTTTPNGPKS